MPPDTTQALLLPAPKAAPAAAPALPSASPDFLPAPRVDLRMSELKDSEWTSLRSRLTSLSSKRIRQMARFIPHIPGYLRLRSVIKDARMAQAVSIQPVMAFKFLGGYLALSFRTGERLRILMHHYRRLGKMMPGLEQRGFPARKVLLWSHRTELDCLSVSLALPGAHFLEGDLSLVAAWNERKLYKLTLTFVPGDAAGADGKEAILIGGSQGFPETGPLFRQAAKSSGEICPATLLLLAAQAMALSLGIPLLLAVPAQENSNDTARAMPEQAQARYDRFWECNGGERDGAFYRLPLGVAWKPMHLVPGHRSRTRRKREMKERILAQMRANLEDILFVSR